MEILPWPSGHGPIEARSNLNKIDRHTTYFRGLRVTAPLKRESIFEIWFQLSDFRGLRVTAPLKPNFS